MDLTSLSQVTPDTKLVVAAIIIDNGRIMAVQRGPGKSHAGLWEFPGGKVEPGESQFQALSRELYEELRVTIKIGRLLCKSTAQAGSTVFLIHFYLASITGTEPKLSEHSDIRWLWTHELDSIKWMPADRSAVATIQALVHL